MIRSIQYIAAIIEEHKLMYIVCRPNRSGSLPMDSAEGSTKACLACLARVASLCADEAFVVEAWQDEQKRTRGGAQGKLGKHFEWIAVPEKDKPAAQPIGAATDMGPVMAAINGLSDRLAAMEEADDDEPEKAPAVPVWAQHLIPRLLPLADALVAKLTGQPVQLAAIAPTVGGIADAPEMDEKRRMAICKAALRAAKDPANAQFVEAILAQYGDRAAEPANDANG